VQDSDRDFAFRQVELNCSALFFGGSATSLPIYFPRGMSISIHKEVSEFKSIEAVSNPMRELIEKLWPELAGKLPPKSA
jgi:hypothetical protein